MADTLTTAEQRSILTLALMAARADGHDDASERAALARVTASLPGDSLDAPSLYQAVLMKTVSMTDATAALTTPATRQLAYDLCVGVCTADNVQNEAEVAFLASLREALNLTGAAAAAATAVSTQANALAVAPVNRPSAAEPPLHSGQMTSEEQDRVILHYAILNGALELLPDSMSTLAIVPLQMKMVYRIGQSYGVELDAAHVKEFIGTAGIGLASQFVEQIGVKLAGSIFGRGLLGSLFGGVAEQSVSSGFSFATTYALGRLAVRYYSSGRTLSTQMLRDTYQGLLSEAKGLQGRYLSTMREKATTINVRELLQDIAH